MKKPFGLILAVLFLFGPLRAKALDSRLKVLLTTAAYGTAGGALLGTASMAFGSSGRSILQGASLGLYAGLIFGGYIIYSHHSKRAGGDTTNQYPEDAGDSPYSDGEYEGTYDGAQGGGYGGGANYWSPYEAHSELRLQEARRSQSHFPQSANDIPLHIPLVNWSF